VIVLTGVEEDGLEAKALKLGAKLFLKKPYDTKKLIQRIHELLAWEKK
jgi:DNA-binding response OmpR family regulator